MQHIRTITPVLNESDCSYCRIFMSVRVCLLVKEELGVLLRFRRRGRLFFLGCLLRFSSILIEIVFSWKSRLGRRWNHAICLGKNTNSFSIMVWLRRKSNEKQTDNLQCGIPLHPEHAPRLGRWTGYFCLFQTSVQYAYCQIRTKFCQWLFSRIGKRL